MVSYIQHSVAIHFLENAISVAFFKLENLYRFSEKQNQAAYKIMVTFIKPWYQWTLKKI